MTEKPKPRRRLAQAIETPRAKRAARRAPAAISAPTAVSSAPKKAPGGKLGLVVSLLSRPEGATVAQLGAKTGWQPHSVRGALAGALKKKHGLIITSEPTEDGRVYRLAPPAA